MTMHYCNAFGDFILLVFADLRNQHYVQVVQYKCTMKVTVTMTLMMTMMPDSTCSDNESHTSRF